MIYGMIESPIDERDWTPPVMMALLPKAIRTPHRASLRDQGEFGTCVAESMASWVEANELRERGVRITYSEGYVYGNRAETDHQGEGMIPRQMLMQNIRHGTVRRSMFSVRNNYTATRNELRAHAGNLKDEGFPTRIRGFVRLMTMTDVYAYMMEHEVGILVGCSVDSGFTRVGASGIIPAFTGPRLGGHMMYAPDIVSIAGTLRLALQNSWAGWGDGQRGYMDIATASGLEMWGPLPDDSSWYTEMPNEIILTVPADHSKRHDFMWVDNRKVEMPVGPFYVENKLCTALREPFEAMGAEVEWTRLADKSDVIRIRPRKGRTG